MAKQAKQTNTVAQMALQELVKKTYMPDAGFNPELDVPDVEIEEPKEYVLLEDKAIATRGGVLKLHRGQHVTYPPLIAELKAASVNMKAVA